MTRGASALALTAMVLLAAACSNNASTSSSEPEAASASAGTSDSSATPATTPATAGVEPDVPSVVPEGFATVQARITAADGEVCEVCLWLADEPSERARGLMGVTDLGDAVGMAFRFDEPTSGSFYMFQTPTPLSIAWFGPDGSHVGSTDMEPCLDGRAGDCPLYSPEASYDVAIEVFRGGLEPLGIGAGSRVDFLDGTEADRCPDEPTL